MTDERFCRLVSLAVEAVPTDFKKAGAILQAILAVVIDKIC